MTDMLTSAIKMSKRGFVLHPLKGPQSGGASAGKIPILKKWEQMKGPQTEEQLTKWFKNTSHNIGLVCGKASGVMVFDQDGDLFTDYIFGNINFDKTLKSSRTHGRGHMFFKYDSDLKIKHVRDLEFDFLTDGGNIVLPPSVHASGDVYRYNDESLEPVEMPAEMKERILKLIALYKSMKSCLGKCRTCFKVAFKERDTIDFHGGDGRLLMVAMCTDMKANGATANMILLLSRLIYRHEYDPDKTITEWNNIDKDKTWKCQTIRENFTFVDCSKCSQREQAATVHSDATETRTYHMTDWGNARRIDDMFGEDLLYCRQSKKWFNWCGGIWQEDDIGTIFKLAKKSVVAIHDYAASLPDGDIETDGGAVVKEKSDFKKKWQKHASSSESTARLKAMVENLQTEDNIPMSMEDMDLNGRIIPVKNGTVDLKTGKLYESKREDMCTKMINVVYDPAAICPNWDKFLSEVLPDPDTRRYMMELVGYCLTGETKEEQVYILYGTGSNGKSTFTDTILLLLGGFGINVKASTLLTSDNKQSTPDNEIVRLKGKRMASAAEPKKGIRLGEDVIKAITNAKSKIVGRYLYQEPIEFFPTHKTLLSTNHKPTVTDQSRGMKRRLRLIPFTTTINEDERDRALSDKLENELSGVLNWAIEGCLSWQKAGYLKMSDEIERETAGYMADMDRVGEFLATVTEPGEYKDIVPNMWLRDSYNEWAERMGFRPMNNNTFNEGMKERDFKHMKIDGRVHWRGLKRIITKIEDINKTASRETSRDLVETETTSRETVDTFLDILKTYNNNNGGSCDIEDIREYIEKEVSLKVSTVSLDSETVPPQSHLIAKKENNNGNGSCNGANVEESVNDKPGEITLEMKRLSKKDKGEILDKMKVHFEGSKNVKLSSKNLIVFCEFVVKTYPDYNISDVMEDTAKRFSMVVEISGICGS